MVKCLLEKSIKDDYSPNDERGIFTLSDVKIKSKPNCNCCKNETKCLEAQCDDDLSLLPQGV
jgi:hypothetical protein